MLKPTQKRCLPAVNEATPLPCRVERAAEFCAEIGPGCNTNFLSSSFTFDGGSTFPQTLPFWKWSSKDWEQPHQGQLLSEGHSWREAMFTPSSPSLPSCPSFFFFLLPLLQFWFNTYFVDQKWTPDIVAVASSSSSHSYYVLVLIRFFLSQQKIHSGVEEILKTEKPQF